MSNDHLGNHDEKPAAHTSGPVERREPWAFIAHKDGRWGGLCVADKDAGKFLAPFINKGYSVTTVYSRDEYLAELAKLDRRAKVAS